MFTLFDAKPKPLAIMAVSLVCPVVRPPAKYMSVWIVRGSVGQEGRILGARCQCRHDLTIWYIREHSESPVGFYRKGPRWGPKHTGYPLNAVVVGNDSWRQLVTAQWYTNHGVLGDLWYMQGKFLKETRLSSSIDFFAWLDSRLRRGGWKNTLLDKSVTPAWVMNELQKRRRRAAVRRVVYTGVLTRTQHDLSWSINQTHRKGECSTQPDIKGRGVCGQMYSSNKEDFKTGPIVPTSELHELSSGSSFRPPSSQTSSVLYSSSATSLFLPPLPPAPPHREVNEPMIPSKDWSPDRDWNSCERCKVVAFTLIRRRHHCRYCGRCVCGACSEQRIPYRTKNLRACKDCHQIYLEDKKRVSP